ncbi:fibronectin type III domain-containing protein [Streptomyces toxytricini]|uniref:fibronectin type III domain-containing protein n=1 Tax=Streptomyces toxytricini TaxID=67369 RepID=UPI00343F5CF9
MKLGRLIAALVLLAPIPFLGAADSAAAAQVHTVAIEGYLRVYASSGLFGGGHIRVENFSESIRVTHARPTESISEEACAGDEARGELRVTFDLRGEEVVTVVRLRLYEGANCFSGDRDAEDYRFLRIDESESRQVHAYANSDDEFGSHDAVSANFTVSQNTGPPPEPSHVVASRLSAGRVEITWVDEARLETGYEIRFNSIGGAIKRLPPNTTSYAFSIPGPTGPKQCIQVRAVGVQGPSEWTPVGPFVECG